MNAINVSEVLNDDRQLRSLTGLGRDEFEKLLNEFTACMKENQLKNYKRKPKKNRQRKPGGGRKSALGSPEHQLLFILFYLKNYPTYDVLAFTFNSSLGCAFESVQRLLPILKQTQKNLKVLPKRTTECTLRDLTPYPLVNLPESFPQYLKHPTMTTVTIELADHVFAAMRYDPEQLAREMRLTAAATWYEQGRISQEMAATLAGLNRTDFLLALARMGKDSFQVDFADLDRELARG